LKTTTSDFSYQNTETPSEDKEGGDTVDLLIVTEKSDNASTFAKTRDDASTLSAFTEMRGNA